MRVVALLALSAAVMLWLGGCERYRPQPLSAQTVLNVELSRRLMAVPASSEDVSPPAKVPFTFARAVELMTAHSPSLKELRAEYETLSATAGIKTPLPNPAVEAGPQFGFGPDVGDKFRLQPIGSLGFALPTGGRLKRQDELNRAHAELAKMELTVKSRELYLELRQDYTQLVLARARLEARQQILTSAKKSTALTKKLIEAGNATALDAGLIALEEARVQTETFSADETLSERRAALAALTGVHEEQFSELPPASLPELPGAIPTVKELQEMLVANHPELARMRAQYDVAERELHLEIAKQYPDFRFGPSYDGETGEKKATLGLTLGIDLPVFDRNQQAVAKAKKHRDEIGVKYEAAANRALAGLDKAWRNCQLAMQKLELVKTVLLPLSIRNMEAARKALEAGATDSLRLLETERGQRGVMLDAIETELSVRNAWIELEKAVGYPLTQFPTEDDHSQPPGLPKDVEVQEVPR